MLPPDALIIRSKCTKMRLAAGLRPDPLGELKRSPDHLAAKGGLLLRGGDWRERERREEEGKGGEEKGEWRGGKRRGGKRKEREGRKRGSREEGRGGEGKERGEGRGPLD